MEYFKPLPIATCLLLMGTGMASVVHATGIADGRSFQSEASAITKRQKMADTTNRIIVKYRQQAGAAAAVGDAAAAMDSMARNASQYAGVNAIHLGRTGTGAHIIKLDEHLPVADVHGIVAKLAASPDVEYAEADRRVFAFYTPNDPGYSYQWHYYEDAGGIRLPSAWDTTKGEGVTVAVIDTGYTEHSDLKANLQLPGIDLIGDTDMSNDGDGRDTDAHDPGDYSPNCGINESSWHGTHTSGTIAAVGGNGIGVIGVAHKAKVLPVRVLGKCGGWISDFADGIVWAAGGSVSGVANNPTPAKVLNVSLGGSSNTCSQSMQSAINKARQLGATIVVAAGNSSEDVAGTEPANCNGVIVVAATDREGKRASFSNYGNKVTIAAPGASVLSTVNSGATKPGGDAYAYYQGTSMAAPHVSGVVALLYSIKPTITPDEVEQVLKNTARPTPGSCNGCGAGLLDAAAAVAAVSGNSTPMPTPQPDPGLVVLENGVAKTRLSGQVDAKLTFAIDVPANATNLKFTISGGTGDADLYVRFGSEPTLTSYDCRPYRNDNSEACVVSPVRAGRYYVTIDGYTAFSGATVVAFYETGSSSSQNLGARTFQNTADYPISSTSTLASSLIDVPLAGTSGTVKVNVEIKHPAMQAVALYLVAPDRKTYLLSFGGQGANLSKTYTLNLGTTPATGRWVLWVRDFGWRREGYIDSWAIGFQ